jgi:hypothetical protein
VRREIADATARLQTVERDQGRIRENLKATPKEADVYGKYLKKLSEQEADSTPSTPASSRCRRARRPPRGLRGVLDFDHNRLTHRRGP